MTILCLSSGAFKKKKEAGADIADVWHGDSRKSDVRRPIYSIDKSILKKLGIKQDPMKVVLERVNRLSETELKKQAEILRPFLFDGSEADLIINAKVIIPSLIERYAPL